LEGAVVRRVNGSLQAQQTFSVSLSLDPLTAEPELLGREIRNHLDAAGIPGAELCARAAVEMVLTSHCDIPGLPSRIRSCNATRVPFRCEHAAFCGVPRCPYSEWEADRPVGGSTTQPISTAAEHTIPLPDSRRIQMVSDFPPE